MEHTQTKGERKMEVPSLNKTRRYQVDPAINIIFTRFFGQTISVSVN